MKRVTLFQTEDGKQFTDEHVARQHENVEKTVKLLAELLKISMRTGRPEAVIREMIEDSSGVSEVLASYRRRLPPAKVALKKAG